MEHWQRIDRASPDAARRLLAVACGATRWRDAMVARRPFGSQAALLHAADEVWWSLTAADWKEAFTHHPRIGDIDALRERFPTTHDLSATEQAGVVAAAADVLTALAQANADYEAKFGFIFIVCATGKTAGEMLALLRQRLQNDPDVELRVAAGEQAKITALRLST